MAFALLAAAPTTPAPGPTPPQSRPAPEPPPLRTPQSPAKPSEKALLRPPRPCPFLAADAKPIFEVKGTSQRVSQAMYPLGFSKQGRFAWLETSRGMEAEGHTWFLHVVNLDNDRSLVNREFDVSKGGVLAMCDAEAPTITRLLERQGIAFGTAPVLAPADDAKAPPTVELVAGRPIEEKSRMPYRVLLRGPEGSKQVGVLWRVEVSSGKDPRAKPVIVGLLRSPFERRVAVVAMQKVTGIEAVQFMDMIVLGGRLDRGWRKEAP
jgi:hypothetical protein